MAGASASSVVLLTKSVTSAVSYCKCNRLYPKPLAKHLGANVNLQYLYTTPSYPSHSPETSLTVFGGMVSQMFEGRRRAVLLDLPRMSRNAALGFALHGPVLHFWWVGI